MAKTLNLTGLGKKNASQVAAEPTVTGHEAEVDDMMRQKRVMDTAKLVFDAARTKLESLAGEFRDSLESKGHFATRVLLQGTKSAIGMTFGDRLSAMTEEAATALHEILGDAFDHLFVRVVGWKFRDDVDLAEFHKTLTAHGINPADWFEAKSDVRPVEGFRKARFELREHLTRSQNHVLDAAIGQLQYTPTLSGVTKWIDPDDNNKAS